MVTIEKIAKKVGVNKSTVSKALRGAGDVGRETAEKIKKTAAEMGYNKKLGKNTHVIAVVVPEIDNAFYSEITNNIIKKAEKNGYSCSVFSYDFDRNRFEKILAGFKTGSVDGFFVVAENLTEVSFATLLRVCNLPFVLISSEDYGLNCDCVWVNEKYGIESVFSKLVALGHKDFAFIGDRFAAPRVEIVRNAAVRFGGSIPDENIILSEERGYACGYDHVDDLIDGGKKFTALIAHYDDIAVGAIKRLKERGLSVPDDVSVVGFDDAPYCKYSIPTLSSINCDIEQLCSVSFKILEQKIAGKNYSIQSVLIRPKLAIRESVAKAKSCETNI